MATTVTYKGATLTTVDNQTKVLETAGTWVEDDFTLVDVSGGGTDNLPTFISNQQLGAFTFTDSSFVDQQFREKKFTSLSLPNLVTSQKDNMFTLATIGTLNLPSLKVCRNNYFTHLYTSSLSLPNLETCGASAFQECTASSLSLPKFVNATGQTAFKNMRNLVEIDLPLCTTPGNWSFEECIALTKVDFGVLTTLPQGIFNKCTALDVLILRSQTMVSLANINAFNNMNGKAVTVYVPSALISSYQSGTNWVNVTGATLTFMALEGSNYE